MHLKRIISVASALFLAVLGVSSAARVFAQERELLAPSSTESPDDRMMRVFTEARAAGRPGNSVVVIDAAINGVQCEKIEIEIGRQADGQWRHATIRTSHKFFGKYELRGMKTAAEGEYYVLDLICTWNRHTQHFNGPHAKFRLGPNELVNVGRLKFDYKKDEGFFTRTGQAHKTVEPLTPEMMAALKEKYPKSVTKMVNRPMELHGGADVKTKPKGL